MSRPTPSDFKWEELVAVMAHYGYKQMPSKGSSSRRFYSESTEAAIVLHKPHPSTELRRYAVRNVLKHLIENGIIDE